MDEQEKKAEKDADHQKTLQAIDRAIKKFPEIVKRHQLAGKHRAEILAKFRPVVREFYISQLKRKYGIE